MYKFLIFALALVVVYSQHAPLKDAKGEAKNVYHQLLGVVDQAINTAQTTLNEALATVKAQTTELGNNAKAELEKTLDPLRKQLNDELAKAKVKGFDVAKCQKYIDDFEQRPNNLTRDLLICFNIQIDTAQKYVNDALNNVRQLERELNTLDTDIDNCGGNFVIQAACYAKITAKIARDIQDVPMAISDDVDKTTLLILNLVPNLEKCAADQVLEIGQDAAEDVSKFAACANV